MNFNKHEIKEKLSYQDILFLTIRDATNLYYAILPESKKDYEKVAWQFKRAVASLLALVPDQLRTKEFTKEIKNAKNELEILHAIINLLFEKGLLTKTIPISKLDE